MALDPVVNFFESEIATLPVASGGTVIVLSSGDGNKLPNPSVDGAFNLTIYEEGNPFSSPEIVRVTARTSDTLTVTRAQEGTSATTKTAGTTWKVVMFPTAKTIQDIDSAKLDVAGGTMTGDLTIPDKIIHSGDANTAIRFPANDTVAIETAGVEALRVTPENTVSVGDSTSGTKLRVVGSDSTAYASSSTSLALPYQNNNTLSVLNLSSTDNSASYLALFSRTGANQSTIGYITQVSGTGSGTTINSFMAIGSRVTGSTSYSEHMRITSAGNVGIGTTSPATKLDVSGAIRASTGILFGTDTAAANTLDDYEEGTWTPVLGGTGGVSGQTYTAQVGWYTKTGNVVIANFFCTLTAKGTITGGATVDGLPFVSQNINSNYRGSGSFSWANLAISVVSVNATVLQNSFYARIAWQTAAGSSNTFGDGNTIYADTTTLQGTIIYRV